MIHQALHGYSNGHDLLASSLTLPREQRSILSQLTDLSGPAPVQGFDGYISGYSLTGEVYVLSKTWYATELPRPGCVWTHSLLLTRDELHSRDLLSLTRLFRRPNSRKEFDQYAAVLDPPDPTWTASTVIGQRELATVIRPMYGDPGVRVCVPTDSATALEGSFLAIWNQQWPALRWEFAFTTGMLGRGGTRRFDLQGIPVRNRRFFLESDEFIIVDDTDSHDTEPWVIMATADVTAPEYDDLLLREFLWTFGNDFSDGRSAFRPLCLVFDALSEPDPTIRAHETYTRVWNVFGRSAHSARLS